MKTEAKKAADKKWDAENSERLNLWLRKKGTKDRWKAFAASQGLSLAQMVDQAVEAAIEAAGQDEKVTEK